VCLVPPHAHVSKALRRRLAQRGLLMQDALLSFVSTQECSLVFVACTRALYA
jgi:hypothetical protein